MLSVFNSSTIKTQLQLAMFVLLLGNAGITNAVDDFASGGLNSNCFTYPAVAMTPYNLSIQNNLYRMTHESVYHNTNSIGSILLYGPVHYWDGKGKLDFATFSATFRDPDGPGTSSQVVVQLRFIGPGGIRIISTMNSNDYAISPTNDIQTMSTAVPWNELNAIDGYYVVRLYIKRTTPNLVPAAFGYNICATVT